MQKQKTCFSAFLITLGLFFSGCGIKKEQPGIHKQSFFSRVKEKYKGKQVTDNTEQEVKAFDLDSNSLNSFAIDDQLEQHKHMPTTTEAQPTTQKLLEWENLAAEESKDAFKRMLFEFNSYILQAEQAKELRYNIKHAKKMIKKGKTIVIEGHACHSAGSAIYNLALSEKRARHVAKELNKAGIDSKHIKIAPRGHEMPLRKGGSRSEQAINRRVELFAIDGN